MEPCHLLLACPATAAATGPIDRVLRAMPAAAVPSPAALDVRDTQAPAGARPSQDSATGEDIDDGTDAGSWLHVPGQMAPGYLCQIPEPCKAIPRCKGLGWKCEGPGRAPRLKPDARRKRLPRRRHYDIPYLPTPPTSGDEGSRSGRYAIWDDIHNEWCETGSIWPRSKTWRAPILDRPPRAKKSGMPHFPLTCPELIWGLTAGPHPSQRHRAGQQVCRPASTEAT